MDPLKDLEGLRSLAADLQKELRQNILPFWKKHAPDNEWGGFQGCISNDLKVYPRADKGLILNTRILWTFARAYERLADPGCLGLAQKACCYLLDHFLDPVYGGFYWALDFRGQVIDPRKQVYGQAFAIFSLAQHSVATGSPRSLAEALRTFCLLESKAADNASGGYFETCERDWQLAAEQRLSAVDLSEKKSTNTHLHLLEAYAVLLRACNSAHVRSRLQHLIELFLEKIITPDGRHFFMFFDESWTPKSEQISFGHEIEGSWLLCEAADVLGDDSLRKKVQAAAVRIAEAVLEEALGKDGALLYETGPHGSDENCCWWAQAEAVVGFTNAFQISGRAEFLTAAALCWGFIEKYIVDHESGEWFWKVTRKGEPDRSIYKVGPWKGPYHNSRMCLEMSERLRQILTGESPDTNWI
jgi:cellobiose epimerase